MSTLSGPINGPLHNPTVISFDEFLPPPRVKPEAQQIYKQHQGRADLLDEEKRTPNQFYSPPKIKHRNHIAENVKRMRKIQRVAQRSRAETAVQPDADAMQPVRALWRSSKYDNVESKVAFSIRGRSIMTPPPQSARAASPADVVPRIAPTADVQIRRNNIDFIRENALAAKRRPQSARTPKRSSSVSDSVKDIVYKPAPAVNDGLDRKHGQLPKYLINRREEWRRDEEERLRRIPDPDQPPGHVKMPDNERRQALDDLKSKEKDLYTQLLKLPLRMNTLRLQNMKADLEQKICEVEAAIKVLSRPKVFVKVEEGEHQSAFGRK